MANAAGHPLSGRHAVLAEVKLAALGQGSLHLGAVDGPLLEPRPLPYVMSPEGEPSNSLPG